MKDTFTWNLSYVNPATAVQQLAFFWTILWKPQYRVQIVSIYQYGINNTPGNVVTALMSEWAISNASASMFSSPPPAELTPAGVVTDAPNNANYIFAPDSPRVKPRALILPQVPGNYSMACLLWKADGTAFVAVDTIAVRLQLTLRRLP